MRRGDLELSPYTVCDSSWVARYRETLSVGYQASTVLHLSKCRDEVSHLVLLCISYLHFHDSRSDVPGCPTLSHQSMSRICIGISHRTDTSSAKPDPYISLNLLHLLLPILPRHSDTSQPTFFFTPASFSPGFCLKK